MLLDAAPNKRLCKLIVTFPENFTHLLLWVLKWSELPKMLPPPFPIIQTASNSVWLHISPSDSVFFFLFVFCELFSYQHKSVVFFTDPLSVVFCCHRTASCWRTVSWWSWWREPGSFGTSSSSLICCSAPSWRNRLEGKKNLLIFLILRDEIHWHASSRLAAMLTNKSKISNDS